MTKKYLFIFLFVAPLFSLILVAARIYYSIEVWTYDGPNTIFEIKPGETFSSINYRLHHDGLISNSRIFHRYCQVSKTLTKFKSGQYEIKAGSNMTALIDTLLNSTPIMNALTIPEGKNIYEIAAIIEENKLGTKEEFLKIVKDTSFISSLNVPGETLEGYLYPETYKFTPGTPLPEIVRTFVKEFQRRTKGIDLTNAGLSIHEVVTLASIVEKETGAQKERPIIAGVFLNRLRKGMKLQSDPTTIYGIYETFTGNLKKEHLTELTPYNTYRIQGLPKGPIANPGIDAIRAVLTPADHRYLFFVSQNDGTHIFTEKYSDHNKAVIEYQKNRKAREGKSWRDLKE